MNAAEDFIILQGHLYQHNKNKFDNRTLQTREIKKFPLFSEHTSYYRNFSQYWACAGTKYIIFLTTQERNTTQYWLKSIL